MNTINLIHDQDGFFYKNSCRAHSHVQIRAYHIRSYTTRLVTEILPLAGDTNRGVMMARRSFKFIFIEKVEDFSSPSVSRRALEEGKHAYKSIPSFLKTDAAQA